MSNVVTHSGATAAGNKVLWAAIGVLGVSTLALGAVVLRHQMGPAEPEKPLEVVAIHSPATPVPVASAQAPTATIVPAATSAVSDKKLPSAHAKYAQVAPKSIANSGSSSVSAPVATPVAGVPVASSAPVKLPAKVVCATCGVVESVTPIQRESSNPSGAGAVAGAVLGGLVGNQFGGGDGKTLATIAGVLGGGWAGNTVEKRMKKDTVYMVEVRMEDGSVRTIEQASSASVGQHVTVEGNRIIPGHTSS